MTTTPDTEATEHEAIHTWFGLTYSNYLVLPRTLLQSMPDEWQAKFVALLEQMQEAFAHVDQASSYKVEAATESEVGELDDTQLRALGYTRREVECSVDHDHDESRGAYCNDETLYDSFEDADLPRDHMVLIPAADPVPHYNRGRTRVEPRPAS